MKPSLLLISGWGFPTDAWAPLARRLSTEWTVRVLDPGTLLSGDSGPADTERIRARIRSHLPAGRPCYLGGWSLGGMLALDAAPGLADAVAGLLLISTTPKFCSDDTQAWGIAPATVRAMAQGLAGDPKRILERFYVSSAAPEEPDPDTLGPWIDTACRDLDGLRIGLHYLQHTDLRDRVRDTRLPAMLLHGRQDTIVPCQASRMLGLQLRPSRLDLRTEAGHDLPLRRPDVVLKGLHALATLCV